MSGTWGVHNFVKTFHNILKYCSSHKLLAYALKLKHILLDIFPYEMQILNIPMEEDFFQMKQQNAYIL